MLLCLSCIFLRFLCDVIIQVLCYFKNVVSLLLLQEVFICTSYSFARFKCSEYFLQAVSHFKQVFCISNCFSIHGAKFIFLFLWLMHCVFYLRNKVFGGNSSIICSISFMILVCTLKSMVLLPMIHLKLIILCEIKVVVFRVFHINVLASFGKRVFHSPSIFVEN